MKFIKSIIKFIIKKLAYSNANNIEWTNVHGSTKKLKDMDDKHLANLLHWANYYYEESGLILVLEAIIEERKLSEYFINNAPYPYKNPNGNMEIWDYDLGHTILLEEKGN